MVKNCMMLLYTVLYCHHFTFEEPDLYHMKLQKRGPIMVQQTNKNGDKKRQFPETLVCIEL
jgi:hypothetical protein